MRIRAIIAIVTLAICLVVLVSSASFFSHFVNLIFGEDLALYVGNDGIVTLYSSTGSVNGPLWEFCLIALLPVAFTIAIVILLFEVRNASRNRKHGKRPT
jgi:hypothetical protein